VDLLGGQDLAPAILVDQLAGLGAGQLGLKDGLFQVVKVLAAGEDVLPTVLLQKVIYNVHVFNTNFS